MTDLFSSGTMGGTSVRNRVFMAPLTRSRAHDTSDIPADMAITYYEQRASGGLIVSEATQINPQGKGYVSTPGIYTVEQVQKWREITEAVHEKGGKIFLQLWHVGRISHCHFQPDGDKPLAPSAIAPDVEVFFDGEKQPASEPQAMTHEMIKQTVEDYRTAAENAERAGFDGVEIHAANGYLIDQFLRDKTNKRTDEYGGSLENRMRFLNEVTDAVLSVWDPANVGIRLSPIGNQNDIADSDPLTSFTYFIQNLNDYRLAYLHMVERFPGMATSNKELKIQESLRNTWKGFYIANGDYDYLSGQMAVKSGYADAVAFGRPYISNPDLPERLEAGANYNEPDPDTFYGGDEKGYIDYPFMDEADM
ncbi:alkene reductase [Salinimonas chungwhensis]|uniref:alkene reductase n=1 Tax=Salinimonas chungwhensis TaxID=265425 RepID=UPI0003639776|nr:alkene reductase [Salinimonas chungwhensis]